MPQKLTDADVGRLKELWAEGWSVVDLASEFGISRMHVGRLVREEQRPVIAGLDADRLRSSVVEATDVFLDGLELGPGDGAIASMARVLAAKLDACAASETASAAAAIPRLSAELIGVLDRLRAPVVWRSDRLDELVQRRAARRLALATRRGHRSKDGERS